ncbi:MAG TPA: TetR/AcrR family transcriptional regulator [Solirubrobacteraceae bacterium]|jgi:AcrR family transcriptional regulator|nr:TetR/AcrR family transcriptional regulator [Solirubrobacteraceae bacterium]
MAAAVELQRRYRGATASERRAERRERLLEAGLELFGTQGFANTTIRAVCAAASVNSRYFYESFTDREDLLFAVYQRLVTDIVKSTTEATAGASTIEEQARAGLQAGWRILTEDRRKAKVIALEVVGVSERLERLRRDTRHALADLTARNAQAISGGEYVFRLDPVLTTRSLIGAVVEILVDWINDDLDAGAEEIVEHFTALFTAVTYAAIEPRSSPG